MCGGDELSTHRLDGLQIGLSHFGCRYGMHLPFPFLSTQRLPKHTVSSRLQRRGECAFGDSLMADNLWIDHEDRVRRVAFRMALCDGFQCSVGHRRDWGGIRSVRHRTISLLPELGSTGCIEFGWFGQRSSPVRGSRFGHHPHWRRRSSALRRKLSTATVVSRWAKTGSSLPRVVLGPSIGTRRARVPSVCRKRSLRFQRSCF